MTQIPSPPRLNRRRFARKPSPRHRLRLEALEDRTVPAPVPPPAGLVSWWTGDNTAADHVGPNHGTLVGGTTYAGGKVGQAFSLDGMDDWISTNQSFANDQSHTIEAWVYWNGHNGQPWQEIASWWNVNDPLANRMFLGTAQAGQGPMRYGDDWQHVPADLPTSRWVHVAATYDGATNNRRVFLDGSLVASRDGSAEARFSALLAIGRQGNAQTNGEYWNGLIDELSLYNRALSAAEIRSIYQAGSDGKIKTPDAIAADRPQVVEGGDGSTASVTFTISRVGNLAGQATVNWATADGTATAGTDYVAASGQVFFEDGESQKAVTVTVNGDSMTEAHETFELVLSTTTPGYAVGGGLATILNDDATLSIGDATIIEGDGTRKAVFTVHLSMPSAIEVTVGYATANGTALSGSDYLPAAGSLVFQPGQTSNVLGVAIVGDTLVEPRSETFLVNLTASGADPSSDLQAVGTILDNDTTNSPSINYSNFRSTTGLALLGQASAYRPEDRLRLTPATGNEAGGAWHTTAQAVQGGFEARFQFLMPGGSDGLAFVIHNSPAGTSALGSAGGGIGYHGIQNSLAIEFDTWGNDWGVGGVADPDGNHVSVQTGGRAANRADHAHSLGWGAPPFSLDNDVPHSVTIDYVNGVLQVYLDGSARPLVTVNVELAAVLNLARGGKAWVGFTAATGGGNYQTHDILNWQFTPLSAALLAGGASAAGQPSAGPLQPTDLQPLVREATFTRQAEGMSPSALAGVIGRVADLGGSYLGFASGNTIWLDDAVGWGRFIDPAPADDCGFRQPGDQGEWGRMDLLPAGMHELGHVLGPGHDDHGPMRETLAPGQRHAAVDHAFADWAGVVAEAAALDRRSSRR